MSEWKIAFMVSLCIIGLWIGFYIGCWIWKLVWAWVDDSEVEGINYLSEKFMCKADENDPRDVDMTVWPFVMFLSSFIPQVLLLGFKYYTVTICILILILVAHTARFARRLNKKYTKHSEDKEIHVNKEITTKEER